MNIEFNRNEDKLQLMVSDLEQRLSKIYEGGGKAKIAKQHAQGKLTARERIDYLVDNDFWNFITGNKDSMKLLKESIAELKEDGDLYEKITSLVDHYKN